MEKTCRRCNISKPLGEFGIDNRRGSPKAICKPCDSAIHSERYALRPLTQEQKLKIKLAAAAKYKQRKDSGLCQKCDEAIVSGAMCRRHADERAAYVRARRLIKVRICPACSKNPLLTKQRHCRECSDTTGPRFKAYQSSWRFKRKLEVFAKYGGSVCSCCGESNPKFLTIDHIDGSGSKHRKEIDPKRGRPSIYRWLKRHNYPPGFRVLCFNCNCGREYNGGICPHEEMRVKANLVTEPA